MRGNRRRTALLTWAGILTALAWSGPAGRQVCAFGGTGSVPGAAAAERVVAVKADRIDTVTNGVIQNGVILIRGT